MKHWGLIRVDPKKLIHSCKSAIYTNIRNKVLNQKIIDTSKPVKRRKKSRLTEGCF